MEKIAFKYFEGRATEAELKELLEWLRKKEHRMLFKTYEKNWKSRLGEAFPEGSQAPWNRLQEQLLQKSYSRWMRSQKIHQFYKIAAIAFFIISLGSFLWYSTHRSFFKGDSFSRVMAEKGHISKVELPDGSLVWLNSGSTIAYNNLFSKKNRTVKLTGEAFFDVKKDETLPMVVRCGQLNVRVRGTRFNINSYTPEEQLEVVLEEGAVDLSAPSSDTPFYQMKSGERLEFNTKNKKYFVEKVNTARYTSWKEGIINIYNLPISKVVTRLERRYNQQFVLEPEVKNFRYTFTIKNEPLEEILQLMEKITPVKAVQEQHVITIKKRE